MEEYIKALQGLRERLAAERAGILRGYTSSEGSLSLKDTIRQLADIWAADRAVLDEMTVHTPSLGHDTGT